ncbi:MAG: FAD-binding protein [Salinibacterium sp.]|nr:FAD-binding protein [Salinibacterium sp.]
MTVGSNWSGHHQYGAGVLHRPRTVEEVQSTVAAARRIRALGSRHSFNDIADSIELVSLEALEPAVVIDEESETVSFSAGMRYGELGTALQNAGWALRNLASLPHISVAGAVATGTHGSGDRNGTLARAVSGIELVDATGALRQISPVDPEFDGAVVSLGALGVVTRLTLDIEPTYQVRQDVYSGLEWTALIDNFDAITGRAHSVSVFTDWASIGPVWLKSRTDAAAPPRSLFGATPNATEVHMIAGMGPTNTTPQLGVPGPWNERLAHFRLEFTPSNGDELQTEYLVPRRHAIDAIEAVRGMASVITPLLHITEFRTMAADSLWLSGAYETDAVGIHFTWLNEPAAVLALLPRIEEALAPFSPRPHWGKLFATVDRSLYPRLPDFVTLAERMDPTGKFRNTFLNENVF